MKYRYLNLHVWNPREVLGLVLKKHIHVTFAGSDRNKKEWHEDIANKDSTCKKDYLTLPSVAHPAEVEVEMNEQYDFSWGNAEEYDEHVISEF